MSKYTPIPEEFDDWAEGLDQDVIEYADKFPFDGYPLVLDEVFRQAAVAAGDAVLDLGVGTGNLAGRFLAISCRVYGLDFSSKMLAAARQKYPQLNLAHADLLGDWTSVLQQSFDRKIYEAIVSCYTFHHFDLETKVDLLLKLAKVHLEPGGRIVIGDIAFWNTVARVEAKETWADLWEEEDYWIADETLNACQAAGLWVEYEQISSCAGVFIFQPGEGF